MVHNSDKKTSFANSNAQTNSTVVKTDPSECIYKFSKPIVIETQDFINNTFEKLLRKIDVNP